jgi:hypothetical protein
MAPVDDDIYWPVGPNEHRGIRVDKLPKPFLKWAYSQQWLEEKYPEVYEAIEELLQRDD